MSAIEGLIGAARAAEQAGDWDLALDRFGEALGEARAAHDLARQADVLRWTGMIHLRRGSCDAAEVALRESRATAESAGLTGQTASAFNCLALVEQFRGKLGDAEEMFARAGRLAEEAGNDRLRAMVEQNLGILATVRGDVDTALAHYGAALASFRSLGDESAAARALHDMGMANADRGTLEEARRLYDKAWALAERGRDVDTLGNIELSRAELHIKRQELKRAREHCDAAFEVFGRTQSKQGMGEAHKLYGVLYREMGHMMLADTHLELATQVARESGDLLLEAEAEHERALVHLAEGRNTEALKSLSAAHRRFTQLEASRDLVDVNRRLGRLQESYLQVVRLWGESIESKDRYTAGHCHRVAEFACLLAEEVGVPPQDIVWFRMGAFLHDVGKTAVPPEILNKPGKLTPDEWKVMRTHTVEGARIVEELGFPWDIAPMVRHHHERWDGQGYPQGLKGEEIPLTARILCVADVYDALTTTRAYRHAYSAEEALRILEQDAGELLDPRLCEAFKRVLERIPVPVAA